MKTIFSFMINNIEFVAAICGGIIALLQWRESNNNKRAEYLDTLLTKLWENKDIQNFILLNDYNKKWYNEQFHRSDDKTIPTLADKTLSFMNYICYVVKVKIIRKEERSLFDYYLFSLAKCNDMRHYLFDLYQYSILNNKPFLFNYFLDVCISQNLLPKEIKDKKYFKYIMQEESSSNKNIPYKIPEKYEAIKNEFSTGLFLQTCSRCKHCRKYSNNECLAKKDISKHFWLPLNQNTPCSDFDFDEEKWN
ncbi:MAG: hypothetical protein K6A15_05630 [Treponema sp.]|nr:hypothetical protein [Treponema sp.]